MQSVHDTPGWASVDADAAIRFLARLNKYGIWALAAIDGDGGITCLTCTNEREARTFIAMHAGSSIYYQPALIDPQLGDERASKGNVLASEWLWADIDPPEGEKSGDALIAWQREIRGQLDAWTDDRPTIAVFSGRGFQLLWKIDTVKLVDIDGRPILAAREDIEGVMRGIVENLALRGKVDHTTDVSRLLRLPGGVNPRTGARAEVLWATDAVHDLAGFHRSSKKPTDRASGDWPPADAPTEQELLDLTAGDAQLVRDVMTAPTERRSEYMVAIAKRLLHHGLEPGVVAAVLGSYPCGISAQEKSDTDRQIERAVEKALGFVADEDERARGTANFLHDFYERIGLPRPEPADDNGRGSEASPKRRAVRVDDAILRSLPPVKRYTTGFPEFDKLTRGVSTRQLAVIMAPPGDGKSGLAVAIARHVQATIPVLYASTELESHEIRARIAAGVLGRSWSAIVEGLVPAADVDAAIAGMDIYVLGCENLPAGEAALDAIEEWALLVMEETGEAPLVIVDYLQDLARGGEERGVRALIGTLATRLRAMSQRLDCAMLAVSSVSRVYYGAKKSTELRDADDPTVYLAAAKESGDVDYAAAWVAFLDVLPADDDASYRMARIAVAKSRHGRVGFASARFSGASGNWVESTDDIHAMADEKKTDAAQRQRDEDDAAMLGAIEDAAAKGDYYTARVWRDRGVIPVQRAVAACVRLVSDDRVDTDHMHPVTMKIARGGSEGYLKPKQPGSTPPPESGPISGTQARTYVEMAARRPR